MQYAKVARLLYEYQEGVATRAVLFTVVIHMLLGRILYIGKTRTRTRIRYFSTRSATSVHPAETE